MFSSSHSCCPCPSPWLIITDGPQSGSATRFFCSCPFQRIAPSEMLLWKVPTGELTGADVSRIISQIWLKYVETMAELSKMMVGYGQHWGNHAIVSKQTFSEKWMEEFCWRLCNAERQLKDGKRQLKDGKVATSPHNCALSY